MTRLQRILISTFVDVVLCIFFILCGMGSVLNLLLCALFWFAYLAVDLSVWY